MLAHLMPFGTEKPSGSRKVLRTRGAGGGSSAAGGWMGGWMGGVDGGLNGGLGAAAEGEPHGPGAPGEDGHRATGSLRSRGRPPP